MKIVKWMVSLVLIVIVIASVVVYLGLTASLPSLSGELKHSAISNTTYLKRDELGTAIIEATNEYDSAFALGYAHAQDRLFQMDLLRRQSAGELAELVGSRALSLDKKHRFHQFRERANRTFFKLSEHEQTLLNKYTAGVNAGANSLSALPFEYYLLGAKFSPWAAQDSLLATYSMYIDLQLSQTEIDFALTAVKSLYGDAMHAFFTLPSHYQSAIDGSVIPLSTPELPALPSLSKSSDNDTVASNIYYDSTVELPDIGSNNWAVSGKLSVSQSALLSNDMHLGLAVPAIWYRAQLNYRTNTELGEKEHIQVTGVSLPGTPAVIVGSNGKIAWGFTNSNVDNVDWVELSETSELEEVKELIVTPEGSETYSFMKSQYGPVRDFNGKQYALKWVAHQDYAVNMLVADLAKMKSVEDALSLSAKIRIPVQNMVVADDTGAIAWQLTGAITARTNLKRHAILESEFSSLWALDETQPANMINPSNQRVWSANARVVGTEDLKRFGDGGYALGARQTQIVGLLKQQNQFDEQDFYDIQLNNQAQFLTPWHRLLVDTLSNSPQLYEDDLRYLKEWQACACSDSVGYTLVRRFRSTVINRLLLPLNKTLKEHDINSRYLLRGAEPAIWEVLNKKPQDWLPDQHEDYVMFLSKAYEQTRNRLLLQYSDGKKDLSVLAWGKINSLKVTHPFAGSLGPFKSWFNMTEIEGFGDSYLPAVQSGSFGASQRLIVRPGQLEDAILTVPGGQSGHFLSDYYRKGFMEYATHQHTPLLPSETKHTITFTPEN